MNRQLVILEEKMEYVNMVLIQRDLLTHSVNFILLQSPLCVFCWPLTNDNN